jgi:hypothetical protein
MKYILFVGIVAESWCGVCYDCSILLIANDCSW